MQIFHENFLVFSIVCVPLGKIALQTTGHIDFEMFSGLKFSVKTVCGQSKALQQINISNHKTS